MLTGACARCGAPFSFPDQWDAVGVAPPATPTCACWRGSAIVTTTGTSRSLAAEDALRDRLAEVTRIVLVWRDSRDTGASRLRARDAMAQIGVALGLEEDR